MEARILDVEVVHVLEDVEAGDSSPVQRKALRYQACP
jgi:hypothetical protein